MTVSPPTHALMPTRWRNSAAAPQVGSGPCVAWAFIPVERMRPALMTRAATRQGSSRTTPAPRWKTAATTTAASNHKKGCCGGDSAEVLVERLAEDVMLQDHRHTTTASDAAAERMPARD